MEELKKEIREFAKQLGVGIIGFASIDRFDDAPRGHKPTDFIKSAQSVISMGVPLVSTIAEWSSLLKDSEIITDQEMRLNLLQDHIYGRCGYETVNTLLEQIGFRMASFLESKGYKSVYFPATYAHHASIMEKIPGFFAPFSHRHAAVRAGLGEFGLNGVVITPQYGPRVRFMSVITEVPLKPSEMLERKVCLGTSCSICVNACGTKCITVPESLDETTFWSNIPVTVDKELCYRKHREAYCWGRCLLVCPVGKSSTGGA